jgi:2,4-diketo-3-deoxy-L-fuconate hydrolase
MKLANVNGRAALVIGDEIADLERATDGAIGPDPMSPYEDWPAFLDAAGSVDRGTAPLVEADLRCAVPAPRQVFAIGLNYGAHAAETGRDLPTSPATFTKFPACLSGPFDDIELVGESTDWEVELVAVIGRRADRVGADDAWTHVAGLSVGQDVSDRELQFAAGAQFSLGKSRRTYGPLGPWVTTLDELTEPGDLALRCSVDGVVVQDARTSDLIFDVPSLIAELSAVVALLPGDVIFTGTPSGVGVARTPQRFLQPGQTVESWIEGIGTMRNRCVRGTVVPR